MQPGEFYKKFPIEMQVLGRYHDMGIFMDRVSKYSRIINVDNLRMTSTPPGSVKSISAGFTATTFVYDEQAETQQQEVAQ
jgi:type IV pilus assembly protein PilO